MDYQFLPGLKYLMEAKPFLIETYGFSSSVRYFHIKDTGKKFIEALKTHLRVGPHPGSELGAERYCFDPLMVFAVRMRILAMQNSKARHDFAHVEPDGNEVTSFLLDHVNDFDDDVWDEGLTVAAQVSDDVDFDVLRSARERMLLLEEGEFAS